MPSSTYDPFNTRIANKDDDRLSEGDPYSPVVNTPIATALGKAPQAASWREPVFTPVDHDPFAAAARTVQQAARPTYGRPEGGATRALDAVGTGLYNAAAAPSRLVNAEMNHPLGMSVSENPSIADLAAENAMNVVSVPGLTSAIPKGAIGSAANSGYILRHPEVRGSSHVFEISGPDGAKGHARFKINGDVAELDSISFSGGPNSMGHSAVRSLLEQFKSMYPNVKEIAGLRTSGARSGGSEFFTGEDINQKIFSNATDKKSSIAALAASASSPQSSVSINRRLTPVDHNPFEQKQ